MPAAVGGCSGPGPLELGRRESARCVPATSLSSHRSLAGLPLVYEVDLADVLPSRPQGVWTSGSWTDGGTACDSWHNAGRAFDLARLSLADGSAVSCRYDYDDEHTTHIHVDNGSWAGFLSASAARGRE